MAVPDENKLKAAIIRGRRTTRDPGMLMIMDALEWYMKQPRQAKYKGKYSPDTKNDAKLKKRIFMRTYMRDYRKNIRRRDHKKEDTCETLSPSQRSPE